MVTIMKSDKKAKIKNSPDIELIEVLGDCGVSIKWEKATGADTYVVQRSKFADSEFKKIATVAREVRTYVDNSIEKEGMYWYRIVAQRAEGDGKTTKKACEASSVNISSIEAPVLEKITNSLKDGIVLSWTSSAKVDEFYIFRRHSFMKKGVRIDSVPGDCFSYTDKKSVNGPLYYYSVQGVIEDEDNLRYSKESNELACANLDKTKVLNVKRKFGRKVIFSLRLTAGADGYILYKSAEENGKYEAVCETKSISELDCTDKGGKKEKGAFYKAACYKIIDGKNVPGPKSEAVYVKYKF